MRNSLYVIGLSFVVISCGSKKEVSKTSIPPKLIPQKSTEAPKPPIRNDIKGGEYYTVNIADPNKNDNTISYGSIVSANPKGYTIAKNYFPAVAQNFRQKYIILHYTAIDHDKSVKVLTTQSVSAHYLVNDLDNSEIYQLVDENKRAYHAGVSEWRKDVSLNDTSIGIEIVNNGFTEQGGKKIFASFPDYQVKKVAELVKDLVVRYQIPPTNVLGHSDIAPTRKQDPGPLFPWKKLYDEYGIGMWYDDVAKQTFLSQILPEDFTAKFNDAAFVMKVQIELKKFGYTSLLESGVWDKTTQSTIEALQYHFRPENYDGKLDMETWAILQALNQKYSVK